MSSDIRFRNDSVLTIPGHVLPRKAGGEAVLLNLDNEEYYGLDGAGSRLWDLLESGATFGQVIDALSDEYEVERDVLEDDVRSVLTDLAENGCSWMCRSRTRLRALSVTQRHVVFVSLVLVPAVQLSLRFRGFVRTSTVLAARSHRTTKATSVEDARPFAAAAAIVAGRRLVGARCLGRSLVLRFLLRRRGIDATLIIGAGDRQPGTPLLAHAWVEVDGEPVSDAADVRDRYPVFDIQLPRLVPARNATLTPG